VNFDRCPEWAEGGKMKKEALKGVTMLVLIITLAFITAVVSANAQSSGKLSALMPFEFNNSEPATLYIIASLR
jgi:hypothetical protein